MKIRIPFNKPARSEFMARILKGALHAHSTYSDGDFSLSELREVFRGEGCQFACMTDHAEFLDEKNLEAYQDECQALSSDDFLFVPGLEYECEKRMHILGYGATRLASSQDPEAVIRHIDDQRAVSVIAHPKDDFFPWIEAFQTLPQGIEVWNSKYDGRYAPRPPTFALQQRLRQRKPTLRAFYGQDLHWRRQYRGLFVEIEAELLPARIIAALADGSFVGRKGDLVLPSSGVLPEETLSQFAQAQQKSRRLRSFLKDGKRMLDRMGIGIPASLKAQLRRIF
jgi:hypothetical protein